MGELFYEGIGEIVRRVRRKEVSPQELGKAQLARIAKLQPQLNAFVSVDENGAKKRALDAETRVAQGEDLGPLFGVPVSIKSCVEVVGWPTPAGSLLREKEIP